MYKTHPDIPESIDERVKTFMLSCFQPEAKDRPSAKQVPMLRRCTCTD